ncbi:hypothetical protein Tco_1205454, partial [Tanacetum coccineum]
GHDNVVDEDVDEQPVQDLALNVDNVFQADDCDAFDSDVDEASTAQTIVHVYSYHPKSCFDEAQLAQYVSVTTQNNVVAKSLTAELATYKEQVELYERRSRFELNEREQKIDEQLRISYHLDRNIKERREINLRKKELHSVKLQLSSTINHNKSMVEEVTTLKKNFQQKENKYLEEFLDMKALKERVRGYNYTKQAVSLNRERGFEQTKECYLTEVIPFFKTLKEHFEGIQKALTKEIKEMKDIFEELEAEVDQNVVHRKHAEIERKNLLIANDNLIADCLSKDVFYITTNSELTVSRFTEMHDAHTVVQARCLELEAELSKLRDKIQTDDHNELVNRFSNLEVNHLNLQLKYQNLKESFGNNPPPPARETPDFDSVFVIGKMKASLQGKDNVIKKLKMQISQLKETRSEADRTLDFRTLDFQITQLTEKVTTLQEQNELFRAENGKIKQHYKELYDSIKITRAKHIEQTTALLTENENLKVQIHNKMQCVTTNPVKPRVLASGCSKLYDGGGDRSRLRNFVKKFIGTVRFGNDHFGAIMGYGDYVIGDSVISRVYYVEGLGHNLFSVGQFCDSDLEVAFRKHSCYVRDTDGVELIKEQSWCSMASSFFKPTELRVPFNDLCPNKGLVEVSTIRLKFEKDHLCSACQLGKSKKHTHKPKTENTNLEVLNTLHMDLCGPMRVQTINGKKYILVIVDD